MELVYALLLLLQGLELSLSSANGRCLLGYANRTTHSVMLFSLFRLPLMLLLLLYMNCIVGLGSVNSRSTQWSC